MIYLQTVILTSMYHTHSLQMKRSCAYLLSSTECTASVIPPPPPHQKQSRSPKVIYLVSEIALSVFKRLCLRFNSPNYLDFLDDSNKAKDIQKTKHKNLTTYAEHYELNCL